MSENHYTLELLDNYRHPLCPVRRGNPLREFTFFSPVFATANPSATAAYNVGKRFKAILRKEST